MQVIVTLTDNEKQLLENLRAREEYFMTTTKQIAGVTITQEPSQMSCTALAQFLLKERIQALQ